MNGNRTGLAALRVLVGAVWLFQAWPQFQPSYLTSGFARQIAAMAGPGNPWHFYLTFLRTVVLSHTSFFAYLTLIGDGAVGVCLILGLLTSYAAAAAILLNLNYALAAGWMDRSLYSTNVLLIALEIVVWTLAAGRFAGADGALTGGSPTRSRRY
ncbi:MAG TPA: TQO small subunit DoxD [Chloroflexota bacterium]|nr:TQO small subunit DoxD [Chloroflexota bacterium]